VAAATPGNKVAALSWSDLTTPNSGPPLDYVIQRSKANGAWTKVTDPKGTATAFTAKSLTNGVSYRFRIAAVNGSGQGAWVMTLAVVPRTVPGIPRSLVAKPANGSLVLTWKAPTSNGGGVVTDYIVEYSVNGTTWTVFPDGTSVTLGTTITGLANGTKYKVRIAAVNVAGTGKKAAAKSATPKAV